MEVILSEGGYGAILTAVLDKFKPYLEAATPPAVDAFFYQGERSRSETSSSFIAAKELAKQEVESLAGERIPDKIAGRILMRQANLTEAQRESIVIKHNALLGFEEVARALRPLDRPHALVVVSCCQCPVVGVVVVSCPLSCWAAGGSCGFAGWPSWSRGSGRSPPHWRFHCFHCHVPFLLATRCDPCPASASVRPCSGSSVSLWLGSGWLPAVWGDRPGRLVVCCAVVDGFGWSGGGCEVSGVCVAPRGVEIGEC